MDIPTTISVFLGICILLLFREVYSEDEFVIVNITQGSVKGKFFIPDVGIPHYRFQGIPYAKPPVGNLRFKAPVAPEPWDGIFEALQEGSICEQPESVSSEDCLFINVFTHQLPGPDPLLPVMVWIHGGAFAIGSGNTFPYGPEFLVSNGVVYVSMNYRLGVFGFLNTEDEAAPGNAGLKDQVFALRWVQENIAAFGGDPDKVTIFGESAGSTSVSLHLLSPMSSGLFRAAIGQSGSVANTGHIRENPRKDAFYLGNNLGYSGNSSQELIEFLRTVSAEDLLQAQAILPEADKYRLLPLVYNSPSLETVVEGEEAFLTDDPITLFDDGKFHNVSFLTGTCSSEGIAFITSVLTGVRPPEEIEENFSETFKPYLRVCRESPCGDVMIDKMKEFYFGNQPVSNETLQNLVDLTTDLFFAEGTMYSIDRMTAFNPGSVFFYLFSYEGGLAYVNSLASAYNITGTSHGDDLGYIFYMGTVNTEKFTDAEIRSKMVTMWTNFARTLSPTPDIIEDIPKWAPYSSVSTNYFDIDAELVDTANFRKERMDFWKDLYASV